MTRLRVSVYKSPSQSKCPWIYNDRPLRHRLLVLQILGSTCLMISYGGGGGRGKTFWLWFYGDRNSLLQCLHRAYIVFGGFLGPFAKWSPDPLLYTTIFKRDLDTKQTSKLHWGPFRKPHVSEKVSSIKIIFPILYKFKVRSYDTFLVVLHFLSCLFISWEHTDNICKAKSLQNINRTIFCG